MQRRHLLIILAFGVTAMLGYWFAGTAVPRNTSGKEAPVTASAPRRIVMVDDPAPKFRRGERAPVYRADAEAIDAGALPGQRVIVFKDQASLEDFLKRAGDRIQLMGRLDALNALRVEFLNSDDLAGLFDGDEIASLVFPVDVPTIGDGQAQAGAMELGAGLLEWLGIREDNSTWGTGVRIAILDTGVLSHPAFQSQISWLDLVGLPPGGTIQNGHGTAVASVIIGQDSLTPGVAPGADIVSVRIANDLGQSDSFLLASGIVAAVDAGARIINISMGSFGNSALVRNAIEYANTAGSLIIAASGNNGTDRVTYPAANNGVIAVGAVDAAGNHLDFSNTGSQLAVTAPGFGVNAAWLGEQAASVSGTSFSSPIIAGAIAAVMTQSTTKNLSPRQAANLLFSYLNDAGEAGTDSAYGAGMPDIGRVLNADQRGIYDAAVASQRIVPPTSGAPHGQIEVLIQNRGTEPLINTAVSISTPMGVVNANITSLAPNAVQTLRVPISQQVAAKPETLRYDSRVRISGSVQDSKPSNDRRVDQYVPAVK
ncbi:MAG: S8 family serine peptidase [Akkermansiaceae bacterium]